MHTIGKFARIGMVSAKTLRFYDEIGLLKPCTVDPSNGYRYYAEAQVADLYFITEMREYGFSLEEIKYHLNHQDEKLLQEAMRKKLDELFKEEQKIIYVRKKLKMKLDYMERMGNTMEFTLNNSVESIEVRVITQERTIKTAGIALLIPEWPPKEPDVFGTLWTKYWEEDISSQIPDRVFPSVRYGVLTQMNGGIYYLVTDEVTTYENIPEGFVTFDIPQGIYAVCTFNAKHFEELVNDSLKKANDYLHNIWFPKSNYKHTGTFSLEVYDERSRRAEHPEMDIYDPVVPSES